MHWDNRWNGGDAGWSWAWMAVMMAAMMVFFVGFAWVMWKVVRQDRAEHSSASRNSLPPGQESAAQPEARADPEAILHERLARGEIGVDE